MKIPRAWWVRCPACGWTTPSYWLSSCAHCHASLVEPQPEIPDERQIELEIPANSNITRDHRA